LRLNKPRLTQFERHPSGWRFFVKGLISCINILHDIKMLLDIEVIGDSGVIVVMMMILDIAILYDNVLLLDIGQICDIGLLFDMNMITDIGRLSNIDLLSVV
jgi:hypothetical protein